MSALRVVAYGLEVHWEFQPSTVDDWAVVWVVYAECFSVDGLTAPTTQGTCRI